MASSDPRPGTKGRDPQGPKVEYREITSRGRRPVGAPFWLALVLVPLLLMWLSVAAQQKRIEKDLGKRSIAALSDKGYDDATVHFEGRDGTVGIKDLNSQQEDEVKDIVAKVSGVRVVAVDENIVVESSEDASSDSDSSDAKKTETDDADATPSATDTSDAATGKSAGNFTLTGGTDSLTVKATVSDKDAQKELIKAIEAEAEAGNIKIVDKVKISKDADALNAEAIASLASEVAGNKGVSVTADSSEIVLEGEVKSETIKDDIEAKAKAAAGDRDVDNKLTVADADDDSTATPSPSDDDSTSTPSPSDEDSTSSPSPSESETTDDSDNDNADSNDSATESECEDISKSVAASLKKQKINFVTGSAKVDSSSMASLKKIATKLKPCVTGDNASDHSLEVNGYTDDSGNAANNKQLSARRAKSVASVLTQYGIPSSKIDSTGYGESNPVASNDTVEGRKKNRRVEILWK